MWTRRDRPSSNAPQPRCRYRDRVCPRRSNTRFARCQRCTAHWMVLTEQPDGTYRSRCLVDRPHRMRFHRRESRDRGRTQSANGIVNRRYRCPVHPDSQWPKLLGKWDLAPHWPSSFPPKNHAANRTDPPHNHHHGKGRNRPLLRIALQNPGRRAWFRQGHRIPREPV